MMLPINRNFMSTQVNDRPKLVLHSEALQPESRCIDIENVEPDLLAALGDCAQVDQLLQSILRVRVVEPGAPEDDYLPDVSGRHEILPSGIRFIPHFPFESGVHYRASFDAGPLGCSELTEVAILDFSFQGEMNTVLSHVEKVFPSDDALPENLLRFYVRFSCSMQRGRAEEHIKLLGPDGEPAPDVLYRPPVELWDLSMRHLTILLDPGRLKRGVGPNRELGPPLMQGREYTLVIGSGMVDSSGRPIRDGFHKRFRVTEPVRERIFVDQWKIIAPATESLEPVALMFPRPLDWALLYHAITIASEAGEPVEGRIAIEQGERRWSFKPKFPWAAGTYNVRIASSLEDICGNTPVGAFDRPFRAARHQFDDTSRRSIPFLLA